MGAVVVIEPSIIEWLLSGEKLLGLIVTVFAVLGGGVSWFWRRVSLRVKDGMSGVETGQTEIMARLKDVEREVEEVQGDIYGLQGRIGDVERGMSSLATSKEVAALDRQMAGLAASVAAQGTTMRMLYEAAMRADPAGRTS